MRSWIKSKCFGMKSCFFWLYTMKSFIDNNIKKLLIYYCNKPNNNFTKPNYT